ncbi:MAG: hypothetical protein CL930_13345 [Deltaproteobacteria bacterium]|nr:hypothetical protein [Deltaproteobacteria bacterium]
MPRIALLIAAILLVYFPVYELGFVSDDHGLITNELTGIAQQSIASAFGQDLWHFQENESGYYRPLMTLSLLLDHTLWGQWAGGYHLQSLLWHIVSVTALFGVLHSLFGSSRAFIGAGLYAFHPLVSEATCFISARNDSMAIALGLSAVWLTIPAKASHKRCVLAAVFAAAACLSKETGIVILVLLPLIDWARSLGSRGWYRYGAIALGGTTALFVREIFGPGLLHSPTMNGAELLQSERVSVLTTLFGKLLWPTPLTDSLHIAYLQSPPIPAAAAALFLLVFLAWAGGRYARVGILFVFVAILPCIPAIASRFLIGERYLIMPLVGCAFALAAVLPNNRKTDIFFLLFLPLMWVSNTRVLDWKTDLSLASSAHSAAPTPYTAAWLAHELAQDKQFEASLPLFEQAVVGSPPTCDFAGEWIRVVHQFKGSAAAVDVATTIWKQQCAGGPGVRGAWAHALLENGDIETARSILTPPPQQCDQTIAVPLLSLASLDQDLHTKSRCESQLGKELAELQPEVDALVTLITPVPAEPLPEKDSIDE